ncbi:MAG: hypothetical protein IJY78_06540 [Bacteroidaceae bacterium]|nr:hypothetical protein [Bacteroidaceae bacterium]
MKTIRRFFAVMMLMITASGVNAHPMSYNMIRDNARFLTDRMAYTLGIASGMIIDDLYRINFDFICGVNDYLDDVALGYRYDDYMAVVRERDLALRILLGERIWRRVMALDYFYRPISFLNHRWSFRIYAHDNRHGHFHFAAPRYYANYRGGHFFRGMRPDKGYYGRKANIHIENRHKSDKTDRVDRINKGVRDNKNVVEGNKGNKGDRVKGGSGKNTNKEIKISSVRVKSNVANVSRGNDKAGKRNSSSRSSVSEKGNRNSTVSPASSNNKNSRSGASRTGRR